MSLGPHAPKIAAAARDAGHPVPMDAIPPPIPAECGFAYCAFQELSTTRAIGFGAGPVPWTAINDYALRYGLTAVDAFDQFVTYVRALDGAWLARVQENKS